MRAVAVDGRRDGSVGIAVFYHAHTALVHTHKLTCKFLAGVHIGSYINVAQPHPVASVAEGSQGLVGARKTHTDVVSVTLEHAAVGLVGVISYNNVFNGNRFQHNGVERGFTLVHPAGKRCVVVGTAYLEVEIACGIANGRCLGINPHFKLVVGTGPGQREGEGVGCTLLGGEHLHDAVEHCTVAVVDFHAHRHFGTVVPNVRPVPFIRITRGSTFFVVPVELHGELILVEPLRAQVLGFEQV